MIDVVLKIGETDLHSLLSTYQVNREITYRQTIVTLDDVTHPYSASSKRVVTFSLLPLTDEQSAEMYFALHSAIVTATFTDPNEGKTVTRKMMITSPIEQKFALLSVDGKRRYKGGEIILREL